MDMYLALIMCKIRVVFFNAFLSFFFIPGAVDVDVPNPPALPLAFAPNKVPAEDVVVVPPAPNNVPAEELLVLPPPPNNVPADELILVVAGAPAPNNVPAAEFVVVVPNAVPIYEIIYVTI